MFVSHAIPWLVTANNATRYNAQNVKVAITYLNKQISKMRFAQLHAQPVGLNLQMMLELILVVNAKQAVKHVYRNLTNVHHVCLVIYSIQILVWLTVLLLLSQSITNALDVSLHVSNAKLNPLNVQNAYKIYFSLAINVSRVVLRTSTTHLKPQCHASHAHKNA